MKSYLAVALICLTGGFALRVFSLIATLSTTVGIIGIQETSKTIQTKTNMSFGMMDAIHSSERTGMVFDQVMTADKSGTLFSQRRNPRVVRLVVISDTHGQHEDFVPRRLPKGDILFHCGDFANKGSLKDTSNFIRWISSLDQYSEKFVIDGNHDRTLDIKHSESALYLPMLFAEAHPSIKLLQDETVVSRQGLVIHGSSWKSCEAESYNTVPSNTDVWMVHKPPYLDPSSAVQIPPLFQRQQRQHPRFWKAWSGSTRITSTVQKYKIPLCLVGHVHYGRGALNLKHRFEEGNSNALDAAAAATNNHNLGVSAVVNAASRFETQRKSGISAPVVIDFDVDTKQVLIADIEPHPAS